MRHSRFFQPSLGGLEPRITLDGAAADVALPAPSSDPFLDPFAPAPTSPDDGGSSTEPDPSSSYDNPFGPAPAPQEPPFPPFDGDQPAGVYLPPRPIGPAGPAL